MRAKDTSPGMLVMVAGRVSVRVLQSPASLASAFDTTTDDERIVFVSLSDGMLSLVPQDAPTPLAKFPFSNFNVEG